MDYSLLMFLGFFSIKVDHINTTESVKFRIVNGKEATVRSQFPYQAAIVFKKTNRFFCGGSIIHKRFVLTAAHCLSDSNEVALPASAICVEVGNIKLFNREEMETLCKDVQSIIIHETFNKSWNYRQYDIGLLEISGGFGDWTDEVNLIVIKKYHYLDRYKNCMISGFGRTDFGIPAPPSRVLRYAEVPKVLRFFDCMEALNWTRTIFSEEICGFGSSSSCNGDSGRPLVCSNKLVGVASRAYNCTAEERPNIYTNVVEFLNWIKFYINDFDSITADDFVDDLHLPSFPPPPPLSSPSLQPPPSAERRVLSPFFLLITIVPLLILFKNTLT